MDNQSIRIQQDRGMNGPLRAQTPASATWDVHEDAEIELLGGDGFLDEVDVVDEAWAPGQPSPGLPAEEVLHVHVWPDQVVSPDDLDIDEIDRDRLTLALDEFVEDETGA